MKTESLLRPCIGIDSSISPDGENPMSAAARTSFA